MLDKKLQKREIIESYISYIHQKAYREIPPTMEEFLSNPEFLGDMTRRGEDVYPVWKDTLKIVAREDTKYIYVLTGAIGIGKTYCAIYGMLYTMCRILCLENPWQHFERAAGGQMSIVFFNLTKSQSESTAYKLFQNLLVNSPWFRTRGRLCGSQKDRLEFPLFKYTFASPFVPGFGSQGEHVIMALLDEVDSPIASEVQREKVVSAYENARRRLDSRFVKHGETLGRFFMVASKQQRLSFLNTFIAKYKTSKNVLVVDVPLWEARPRTDYSSEEFTVSCGDIYNPPKIVETKEDLEQVMRAGYKILRVPMDFYDIFLKDIVGALRDIAGVSVSHIRATKLFPSESIILNCFNHEAVNPVKQMTIEIGLEDNIDLLKFLDLSKIKIPKHIPRFIHQDFSYSGDGDATGLAMSCISGWSEKNVQDEVGNFHIEKKPNVHTDFALRIKARPGDRIPLHRIRKLILDLKKIHHFNIQECTFDLRIGTEDTKQILERAGIECEHLSMDKDPQKYRDFRNLVMEDRWSSPWHPYLHFELKNLEEDPEKNRIDHPKEVAEMEFLEDGNTREVVLIGSKDISDAVAGSATRAIEKCITPVDKQLMTNLLDKCKPKPKTTDLNMLRLAGVDTKEPLEEDEEKKNLKEKQTAYNDLLKRLRNKQTGSGGFIGFKGMI